MMDQSMNKLKQGFELEKLFVSPEIVQTLIDEIN